MYEPVKAKIEELMDTDPDIDPKKTLISLQKKKKFYAT